VTVLFNPAFAPEGHPEWWGAVSNTPAFDCEPALSACVAACPVTRLQPADYWIARTWKLTTNWRTIQGVDTIGMSGDPATRIVTAIAGIDIVQMGPDHQPAHTGDFLQGVQLKGVAVTRSVAPEIPPAGPDYLSGVSGVRMQYVVQSLVERVWSTESINAFYIKACVATYIDHTHAARTLQARLGEAGTDRYFGYVFDSSAKIGMANGNASVYIDFFSSLCANVSVNAFAYTYGGFTDLFFNRGECSGHANGMWLNGGGKSDTEPSAEDCHIHHVIMDGLSGDGIKISQSNSGAAVTISQCYATNISGVSVRVVDNQGAISVTGCQFGGTNRSTGMLLEGSAGVTSVNNIYTNFGTAMAWKNSECCESTGDTIQYFGETGSPDGVVQMISCVRCIWRSKIKGSPGPLAKAVVLTMDGAGGGSCDYNLVDCSGIDPRHLAGGPSGKLTIGGASATAAGVTTGAPAGYSHNVVAGVMD
jgi:hypothetical protein